MLGQPDATRGGVRTNRARLEYLADRPGRLLEANLIRLEQQVRRLEQRNRDLTRQLLAARHERRAESHASLEILERADTFERRYIGVCSLLRMVLDQFDGTDQ
jgi:hypothetical protein